MKYYKLLKIKPFIAALIFTYSVSVYAAPTDSYPFSYPHFYAGLSIGYGETTWTELSSSSDDFVVEVSVPKSTRDFGTTWGAFLGYQFSTSFALESTYTRYPNTRIFLNDFTFYSPLTEFTTRTQVFSLIGKFILPMANSRINAFLDAGVAFTHRNDVLAKVTRVAPTFGLGIMSNITRRLITELGFEYYIGYGKSERNPVKDYVPFLYGVYLRLGYRFL